MAPIVSLNDGVLCMSLIYLSIDMQYQWAEFESCHWPVHTWLLVSYIFILAFRVTHILGTAFKTSGSGDFLLNLRHKDMLPRLMMTVIWVLVLPLFAAWTSVGTWWLYDSKRLSQTCLPMGMPLCFIIVWQVLSYAWILIHGTLGGIAWVLEGRLRRTEANLREMEDPDTVARWGAVSDLSGYTALANNSLGGLAPEQIKALPKQRLLSFILGMMPNAVYVSTTSVVMIVCASLAAVVTLSIALASTFGCCGVQIVLFASRMSLRPAMMLLTRLPIPQKSIGMSKMSGYSRALVFQSRLWHVGDS